MSDEILSLAKTLSGASEQESELLETLCAAAEDSLRTKLRQGITQQSCAAAYPCAAAMLAAASLLECRGGQGGFSSFTAGTVSVSGMSATETGASADRLRREAWRLMEPYVNDEGFLFCGVRG